MLFLKKGFFESNAGLELPFKIECNDFEGRSIEDVLIESTATIARIVVDELGLRFREVRSIPRGGDLLAAALRKYCSDEGPILIVDDVYSTGGSMERAREEVQREFDEDPIGFVIVTRGECPDWITPFLSLHPRARI